MNIPEKIKHFMILIGNNRKKKLKKLPNFIKKNYNLHLKT